jgi:uncharacterized damage-inducible protein DinB
MTVKDLEVLYEYDSWANKKLFHVVSQLTSEQLTHSVAGAYGSIRNTMVHVLSAEWGWIDRCGGAARGERLNPDDYPTLESLLGLWAIVEGHLREFLSRLADEDLARSVEFSLGSGDKHSMPIGQLLQHGAVHAVHHRGQIALLLRSLGYVPGNFDILLFFAENGVTENRRRA